MPVHERDLLSHLGFGPPANVPRNDHHCGPLNDDHHTSLNEDHQLTGILIWNHVLQHDGFSDTSQDIWRNLRDGTRNDVVYDVPDDGVRGVAFDSLYGLCQVLLHVFHHGRLEFFRDQRVEITVVQTRILEFPLTGTPLSSSAHVEFQFYTVTVLNLMFIYCAHMSKERKL